MKLNTSEIPCYSKRHDDDCDYCRIAKTAFEAGAKIGYHAGYAQGWHNARDNTRETWGDDSKIEWENDNED